MNLLEAIHNDLEDELTQVAKLTMGCIDPSVSLLLEAGGYFFNSFGKRLRPMLTIICCNLFAYKKDYNNIKIASAIELIHAATLLHDDVIDNSMMRRFNKTVNAIWENKTSVLVGDILLSHAFKLMIDSKSFPVLECLSNVINKMIIGELQQLDYCKKSIIISQSQYYEVIANKTAHLFAAACKVSGVMSGQSEDTLQLLNDFGYQLGILFQITDDFLDYRLNSSLGKNPGDDFLEGKVTLPIILLLESVNSIEANHIRGLLTSQTRSMNDFNELLQLMKHHDIDKKITFIVSNLKNKLYNILKFISVKNQTQKDYLYDIVNYCVGRLI